MAAANCGSAGLGKLGFVDSFPFDEGYKAAQEKLSKHTNPYKSPNTARTDDVKSDAWLRGFDAKTYSAGPSATA